MNARLIPTMAAVAAIMYAMGFWLGRGSARKQQPEVISPLPPQPPSGQAASTGFRIPSTDERAAAKKTRSLLGSLFSGGASENPLSPEDIEAYVALSRTNAQSLLAAFETSHDLKWLQQAAEKYPDDPSVMFAVANFDAFPGQKQEWLDKLGAAAP